MILIFDIDDIDHFAANRQAFFFLSPIFTNCKLIFNFFCYCALTNLDPSSSAPSTSISQPRIATIVWDRQSKRLFTATGVSSILSSPPYPSSTFAQLPLLATKIDLLVTASYRSNQDWRTLVSRRLFTPLTLLAATFVRFLIFCFDLRRTFSFHWTFFSIAKISEDRSLLLNAAEAGGGCGQSSRWSIWNYDRQESRLSQG